MLTFEQPLLLLCIVPIGLVVYLLWRQTSLPFPRKQRLLILGSRLLLFLLIIAALAGAAISLPVSRQAVVFVGDISASADSQRTFMENWINSAIQHKGIDDQIGIVAVGRNALVEQSVSSEVHFSHFESTPDTNYTDLAAGLRLAAAILPTDSLRRIVLLSDGQQNLGDALQEAQLLQQEGIRLDIVTLPDTSGPEARVDGLNAPSLLRTNERFLLHVSLFTNVAQQASLHLYLDQTLLTQQPISLQVGEQEVSFSLLAPPPGFHTFRVTLDAPHDTILANNEAAVFVNVQGPPHVLVIEGSANAGANIIAALQATKIEVTAGTPSDVPTTLDGLAGYSAVVLANVPAVSLGTTRMQVLQAFVRDLGRGLVVSGGENSYGVGGYAGTPLEETLPVKMDIPQHKDSPTIAVVLIVESLESNAEVNISKEAAKGVISLLTPRDQVGISSAYGSLTVPMQYVTDKAAIDKAIDTMNPNDPGSYMPDLVNAENVLLKTNAKIKHVILLGDGDAFDNYNSQVIKMASENITVSTVVTNADTSAELYLMKNIASLGKGRFYRADNPNAIPSILLQETQQAARRAIINDPFIPAIVGNHPILTGLGPLPGLTGYVATTPKPAAQLVLVSHLDDPVLAVWQYGLGRVVAWTSDALGEWTASWLQWSQAPLWWANLVEWTLPSPDSTLDVNTTVVGGSAHLTVDIPSNVTVSSNAQQQMQVHIIAPDLSQQTIALQPTAPARWEGSFPVDMVGGYLLQVTWQATTDKQGTSQLTTTTGMIVPYSPEYHTIGVDTRFLTLLAHAGGGSMLGPTSYAAAFAQNLAPVSASLSIVFWLLALAALLLPIDVALRRLSSLEFILLTLRWVGNLFRPGRNRSLIQASTATGTSIDSTLGSLRAKRQERQSRASSINTVSTKSSGQEIFTNTRGKATSTPSREVPSTANLQQEKPEVADTSMANKLLEAKRNRTKARNQ